MTNGDKVVAQARKYLSVRETSKNAGPFITAWQNRWGMGAGTDIGPQPWCGMFADAMFAEADVDDAAICHPAAAEAYSRAQRGGYVWKGGPIPAGALWIKNGIHICIVQKQVSSMTVLTIDGNSSDAVKENHRPVRGAGIMIAIPPSVALEVPPKIVTRYYFDDTKADPYALKINGKIPAWKLKKNADKTVENMLKKPSWRAKNPRVVKTGKGLWAIQLGGQKTWGPFETVAKRSRSYRIVEERVGKDRLRTYSKNFKVKEN